MMRSTPKEAEFTTEDLFRFGLNDVAYVKPVVISNRSYYAAYAADGTPLLVAKERDLAFAALRQNELQPASVH